MTDSELCERLRNMATDAHLSGRDDDHEVLSLAAIRLMLLSSAWHPTHGYTSGGVRIGDWEHGRG